MGAFFYAWFMDWQIFWTALTGAVGGAIIGGGATFMVTILSHRHERKQWLRKERLEAYASMLEFLSNVHDEIRLSAASESDMPLHHFQQLNKVSGRTNMLASPRVSKLMGEYATQFGLTSTARQSGDKEKFQTEQAKLFESHLRLNVAMANEVQQTRMTLAGDKNKGSTPDAEL